jgi:hypothetical protein
MMLTNSNEIKKRKIFILLKKVNIQHVTTLALGSQPKQGLAKVWAKSEAYKSHFVFSRM